VDLNNDGKKDLIVGDTDGYVWIFLNTGTDASPMLAAGRKLQVNGKDFKPEGGRSKPWVVDWNNDGKKDLIVGVENGQVLLLLNNGTAKSPSFGSAVPLKLGNPESGLTAKLLDYASDTPRRAGSQYLNGGMRVCPVVWDWNKDGKKDLLCADEFGKVTLFENLGTDASPVFKDGIAVQARGAPLCPPPGKEARADFAGDGRRQIIRVERGGALKAYNRQAWTGIEVDGQPYKCDDERVKLAAGDWNGDKKADLLLGVEDGRVLVLISQCQNDRWVFAKPIVLQDGAKPLQGGRRPFPSLVDWNKDGKKDLLCQSADGPMYWFENQGTDLEPRFEGRQPADKGFSPIYGGYRSRLTLADWNNDGKPDLLYGVTHYDSNRGYLYLFVAE
jgi:hypothetical protein